MSELERLRSEVVRLQAFKEYVHKRLDGMSVPTDPVPEFTASTGCRIGTRLDWLVGQRASHRLSTLDAAARAARAALVGAGFDVASATRVVHATRSSITELVDDVLSRGGAA